MGTSSSSSSSYSSSSSSSGFFCAYPECAGSACIHFSSWRFSNISPAIVTNNRLYALFNNFSPNIQQVEIYTDPTYFDLVAIGQRSGSGIITLDERNGSGITGEVTWDGTAVYYTDSATLHCLELSSSSSSNSLDSSSSSSFSSLSNSSSSSNCCTSPYCEGAYKNEFSLWSFSGMKDGNSDNCRLYVGLESDGIIQQIRIYKDSTYSNLVAIGQRSGAGSISLSQVNASGLSGSVTWSGTPVLFPNTLILDCQSFSSSTSSSSSSFDSSSSSSYDSSSSSLSSSSTSSSSSIDSSSSSSSSSYGISSSSSRSSSSESTGSSSSSSSSSSIDSSSSSSESIGNTSSSSSSSVEIWERLKPLRLGLASNSIMFHYNRMAQTIKLTDSNYYIGNVYCYLYGKYGTSLAYNIKLAIYDCNNDGTPKTLLHVRAISSSSVTDDGWYEFSFDVSGVTPTNGYLSFVMWQENGDESNYVIWGYSYYDGSGDSKAFISQNGSVWETQDDTVRALRVSGNQDFFDFDQYCIISNPATLKEIVGDLSNGAGSWMEYNNSTGKVSLSHPDLLISLVADSSGSMGWNDRFGNRITYMQHLIDQFKTYYPSNVLFDIVKFGAIIADNDSIVSQMGDAATINLDISTPDRTTYIMSINSASASEGAVYTHNNHTYTVQNSIFNETSVEMLGTGLPLDSGTLVKVSGSGDATIVFNSFEAIGAQSSYIIAYGFKNLENGHTYNIGDLQIDNNYVSFVGLNNWNLFYPTTYENPSISLGNNGPKDSQSIDIVATQSLNARKLFRNDEALYTSLIDPLDKNENIVVVEDASSLIVGQSIDILDGVHINMNREIVEINGNSITFADAADYDIWEKSRRNSIVQQSSYTKSIYIDQYTTAKILVRDVNASTSKTITFYLQTADGYIIEWDIEPHKQWYIYNLYWLDETAIFNMVLKDIYGNPFVDGTKINMAVDNLPSIAENNNVASTLLERASGAGSYKIYVDSLDGFARNMSIDIVDNSNNIQTVDIYELGEDSIGYYLELYDPLLYTFDPDNGAKVIENTDADDSTDQYKNEVPFSLSIIDTTPIYRNKSLDPSLLKPYDPDPVDPTDTYSELNFDIDRIRRGVVDTPSIDGYAVAHVLPITQDFLKTKEEKENENERLMRTGVDTEYSSQTLINDDDITTTTTTMVSEDENGIGDDYVIQTPVYTSHGIATSTMKSSATSFSLKRFDGLNIPGMGDVNSLGGLFAKSYTIYPYITQDNLYGKRTALQFLKEFEVDFIPSVSINSTVSGLRSVPFWRPVYDDVCGDFTGYEESNLDGTFASLGENITINYTVSNKFILVKNGTLKIRIYSNRVVNQQSLADNPRGWTQATQRINVKYTPISSTTDGNLTTTTPLSEIDQWRESVSSNQLQDVLSSYGSNVAGEVTTSGNTIADSLGINIDGISGVTSTSTSPTDLFYQSPNEWILASEFSATVYEQTINIVNGHASLTIPGSDVESILFVEASYTFGDANQFESVYGNMIMVANPIRISYASPYLLAPGDSSTYELGTNVIWMDGSFGNIEDNTIVNFVADNISPSVSVTDDGWSGGSFIGPHAPIVYDSSSFSSTCLPSGDLQAISINVEHSSGYSSTVTRYVLWTPTFRNNDSFYLHTTKGGNMWADGSYSDIAQIQVDLDDSFNPTDLWVGQDGCERLLGKDQPDGLARRISVNPGEPSTVRFDDNGTASFYGYSLNKNIGHLPPYCSSGQYVLPYPWEQEVRLSTSYIDAEGKTRLGTGCTNYYVNPEGQLIIERPILRYIEPLGITTEIEAEDRAFVRDGVSSPNIVATVTWKGEHLRNTVVINEGTNAEASIPYDFPSVTFQAGTCYENNLDPTCALGNKSKDSRNLSSGCLTIVDNDSVSLKSYTAMVGLFRTDLYTDGSGNIHTHACTVDSDGNGTTTSTITIHGSVSSHTHLITDYISNIIDGHSHGLRSVAITQLNPTTDQSVNIAINGYTIYDPTKCLPYGDEPANEKGNRMMFSTLYIDGHTPTSPSLKIDLFKAPHAWDSSQANRFYTALTPGDTDRSFDIRAHAYIEAYEVEDYEGHYVTVPAQDVDDGTRIFFEVKTYKPEDNGESDPSDIFVCSQTSTKKYLIISVKASVSFNGLYAENSIIFPIVSNLQWLPGVVPLVFSATNDSIYIQNALNNIDYVGASPIHDAVKTAADRLIQLQNDNEELSNYRKAIILLTDADENTSDYSIDQAIASVNFIDVENGAPLHAVKLGYSFMTDDLMLKRYTSETGGNLFNMIDMSNSDIFSLVDESVADGKLIANYGTYTSSISFQNLNLPSTITLNNVYLPSNTFLYYQWRTSEDNSAWTTWSAWYNYNETVNIEENMSNIQKYLQFRFKAYGNQYFETPLIGEGITVEYFDPQNITVYFEPIDLDITADQYLSSIHITDMAEMPATSDIYYGITQNNSNDFYDYYSTTRNLFKSDKYTVLLSRYNEMLFTTDYRIYTALNGGWAQASEVDIYRINSSNPNGILVDKGLYTVNSKAGTITFNSIQKTLDYFTINISFDSYFRVACRIRNYGSQAAILHYIALIYNTMQRVPRDAKGNIIHKPISSRV